MTDQVGIPSARLAELAELVREAIVDASDALDTTLMSDAKSSVYQLRSEVEGDTILPPEIKVELSRLVSGAWTGISGAGGETTYERAAACLSWLGQAERFIQTTLGNTAGS